MALLAVLDDYLDLSFIGLYQAWVVVLQMLVTCAIWLSVAVSLDRLFQVVKYSIVKLRAKVTGVTPESRCPAAPLPAKEQDFPIVGVQLPMFNEKAVCQAIIDCAASLNWPASRLRIQVLDDSTDRATRDLVDDKAAEWRERGINVEVVRRTNRSGYKAGALKEGLELLGPECAYVAIFDADFKPEPDFLEKSIPYLEGDGRVGFVQARWAFTNPDESLLTKSQELSLNFHCKCEQYVHFATGSFFNFNGTAGVWRTACIRDVGGWESRTTVEDMDLSLRAYVHGWSAVYLEDTTCLNELPASFFAYRKQQHRWTCGPVQLLKRAAIDVWNSRLPIGRKVEMLVGFFGIRKLATHAVSLGFFCTLVPLTVYTPEIEVPLWALLHLPVAVTICTAAFSPASWHYGLLYVLFENGMGLVKVGAVLSGMLDLKRANEWVVTTKAGSSDKRPGTSLINVRTCRLYALELAFAAFTLGSAGYAICVLSRWTVAVFLLLQGSVFLAFAFNMVDSGALLGFRLDNNAESASAKERVPKPVKASRHASVPALMIPISVNATNSAPASTTKPPLHGGTKAHYTPVPTVDADAASGKGGILSSATKRGSTATLASHGALPSWLFQPVAVASKAN